MAKQVVLILFLLLCSFQCKSAVPLNEAANKAPDAQPDNYPSNLQPAASPGAGAPSIGTGGVFGIPRCFNYLIDLYTNLQKVTYLLRELSQIPPQMVENVGLCAVPPYTTPEKQGLCLQDALQDFRSKVLGFVNAESGVTPQITGDIENLIKCILAETPI